MTYSDAAPDSDAPVVMDGNRKAPVGAETDRKGRCCATGECDHKGDSGKCPCGTAGCPGCM